MYIVRIAAFVFSGLRIIVIEEILMANGKTPGSNTGKGGGIFQEQGPRGGKRPNYTTVHA
ncbi:hypothetical protein CXB40_28605 [Pseudomonas syringae pv. avii]|uniref:hypothetical protein n=1 Tax=Pseudomonas syringae group genomosp. 3 TaxID=251701 RepID=UPI0009B42A95|nr:hypothetical protein [Pseudomonas syringae group genomosp. 3]POP91447.1 hypothetical protein CXB40_28605 [Pseudomonas syringae pv. avii]